MKELAAKRIEALIFDMDGVIVDSEPLHLRAFQTVLAEFDVPYTEEENRQFLGCKDLAIAKVFVARYRLPLTPLELVDRKESVLARLFAAESIPQPGLSGILEQARRLGIPMAVASSATLPTIELVTETLSVRQYFHNLTSGDEVENGKPAPDVFLLAARRLGVAPSGCLVIEDTLNGIRAAKAAGMTCVAIPCQATMHEDHGLADARLSSLDELDLSRLVATV